MDRISAEQRDTIKRTSSDRLRTRLEQAGWSTQDAAAPDREQLMEAVADLYTVPQAAAEAVELSSTTKELELREHELALRELEIQERREERLAQERDRIAQERRWEEEMALKRAEHQRLQKLDADKAAQEKRLLFALKSVLILGNMCLLKCLMIWQSCEWFLYRCWEFVQNVWNSERLAG